MSDRDTPGAKASRPPRLSRTGPARLQFQGVQDSSWVCGVDFPCGALPTNVSPAVGASLALGLLRTHGGPFCHSLPSRRRVLAHDQGTHPTLLHEDSSSRGPPAHRLLGTRSGTPVGSVLQDFPDGPAGFGIRCSARLGLPLGTLLVAPGP